LILVSKQTEQNIKVGVLLLSLNFVQKNSLQGGGGFFLFKQILECSQFDE
jgi:hypothetical protein